MLFLIVVVGGYEIDFTAVHGEAFGIVTVMNLIHGLPDASIILEFEKVDKSAGGSFEVATTFIAVMLGNGLRSA